MMLPAEDEEDFAAAAAAAAAAVSKSLTLTYLGIDFGTSNSAAAIWDSTRGHPKWMRLGRHELASSRSSETTSSNKDGRVVPSAVLFVARAAIFDSDIAQHDDRQHKNKHSYVFTKHYEDVSSILGKRDDDDDVVVYVGAAAMKIAEQATASQNESSSSSSSLSFPYTSEQVSRALVTSVKRILGMKQKTTSDKNNNNDDDDDKEWIESLPFELVMKDKHPAKMENDDTDDDGSSCASIRVYPLGMSNKKSIIVTPEQVVAIILRSIRLAAQDYLQANVVKKKLQVPGMMIRSSSSSCMTSASSSSPAVAWQCTNCVLGVPAHFGQAQRQTLLRAARLAGFDDDSNGIKQRQQHGVKVVSVLTESTAAAMAYGLFVSASGAKRKSSNNNDHANQNGTPTATTNNATSILVFDMGGGTTDVTIAEMPSSLAAVDGTNNVDDDNDESLLPRFEVKVTHGDAHLGGDDMDEALLRTVLCKLKAKQGDKSNESASSSFSLSAAEHRSLLRQCRSTKERLCGDVDHGLTKPEKSVAIAVTTTTASSLATGAAAKRIVVPVDITQQDLSKALGPCLARAELVVQAALERYAATLPSTRTTLCVSSSTAENDNLPEAKSRRPPFISEVVLVGGATRVLGVRDMLQRLFPPPPDLCLSVNAMSAVAQGTAIKAAMDSKCIPLHELRSAMMLDTTPHAIGVLLDNSSHGHDNLDKDETPSIRRFVEIIPRDDPLPSSGVATFQLADARQAGISFTAVEQVVELVHEIKGGEGSEKRPRQQRLLYPKLGDFTFFLHRLTEKQIAQLKDGIRSVDVCMTLKENGALVVSIFDAHDPEHVARRQKLRQPQQQQPKKRRPKRDSNNKMVSDATDGVLDYAPPTTNNADDEDMDNKHGFAKDQWILIGYCIVLMVLYIAAKLVFQEELKRFKEE
jgi:molecular chaperone DnaK (HSP70)